MRKPETHTDRRNLSRFNLRLRSILKLVDEREEGRELFTRDVSSNGAFFLTPNPPPVDTTLSMVLYLPVGLSAMGKIGVIGKVIRIEEQGMAVEFDPGYTLAPA